VYGSAGRVGPAFGVSLPVLDLKPVNAVELAPVVSHERGAQGQRLGGDQHVVAVDRCAGGFKLHAELGVVTIGIGLRRPDGQQGQQLLDALHQCRRALAQGAVTQFGRDDRAGADAVGRLSGEPLRSQALRAPEDVGEGVGVEQIELVAGHGHQKMSSGCGAGSGGAGSASSSGVQPASSAARP
jgi:hypothetical protein